MQEKPRLVGALQKIGEQGAITTKVLYERRNRTNKTQALRYVFYGHCITRQTRVGKNKIPPCQSGRV
jgi:hypothetical protein